MSLKNLEGKPSLLELASTAGKPATVQALLEVASERMELELFLDSLGALRVVGELEPKLIVPFAAGIAPKLSGNSLGMRIEDIHLCFYVVRTMYLSIAVVSLFRGASSEVRCCSKLTL